MTAVEELATLLETEEAPIERCLLLVSEALGNADAVERGEAVLSEMAGDLEDATLEGVLQRVFGDWGFGGDVDDYHSFDNSFLDSVLERRRGMPITLAGVLIAVGTRAGIGLHGVGLPGHFLVGVDEDRAELRFVDAFAGGVILDVGGAIERYERLFGGRSEFDPAMLAPVSTAAMVSRVLNNLVRTAAERDRKMLDDLLDLRVQLPGPTEEKVLLVRLAESRGRWDLAASLREELDPEDPQAVELRARLN